MANMVRICPACGAWRTDGIETCQMCGAVNTRVDYSEIYWGKIDIFKREEIIKSVTGPNCSLAEADELRAELAGFNIGGFSIFKDEQGIFLITNRVKTSYVREDFVEFRYEDIVSYELIEDGGMVMSGGIGRAVVGDLLFGAAGAIVGATTRKSKNVCSSLEVNIVLRNHTEPNFTVTFIAPPGCDKTSAMYAGMLKMAKKLTSKLELITSSMGVGSTRQEPIAPVDPIAEIRRYKELYDEGILTEEEFVAKKRLILGI